MSDLSHICPACGNQVNPVGAASPRRYHITPRDVEVLNLLFAGKANREIGALLKISTQSVKTRLARIVLKIGIESSNPRIVLARYWSWPIFRIGAGYEGPTPALAADVIERDRVRAQENSRPRAGH